MRAAGDPRDIPLLLRAARPPARALRLAGARLARPLGAADDRRDAALQAQLPRPRGSPGAPGDRRPEVLSHHRHRGGRKHRPPPHLLRDARQLELRRLLQAGVDRDGLAALDRGLRLRPRPDLGDRFRRRRGARARPRHRGGRDLEGDRAARGEDRRRCPARRTSGRAGPTGPCGPCSELYYDRGEEFGAPGERPGDDTDRFLEFWNHVFMGYDLAEDGTLSPLPMRNIDTGMGLERMAAILQDVPSVFETDLLRPLIELGEELSGRTYGEDAATTRAMRIVADHSRGTAFLIADGVVPSNEDRGYILRRIMRRAIQQGRTMGLEAPWLGRFAERTIEIIGDAYPEIVAERESIARWVADEEESFGRTLERGTELLERLIAEARESETSWIEAADAFKLHDTYGFPYDLTKELLAEQGLSVDDQGFEELMDEQRQRARGGAATAHGSEDHHGRVLGFVSGSPPTRFVGYEALRASTGVAALAPDGERVLAKLEESPFYAEGGGQVADSGTVSWEGGEARVLDVYRVGDDQALDCAASSASGRAARSGGLSRHPRRGRGRPGDAARDDAQPHRDPSAARGAAGAARDPRAPGGLRGAAGQAALRLHPRSRPRPRGAAGGRGPGQRLDQGEPAGALAQHGPGRGRAAGGDGAVRREVRRVGAGGRGRRGLPRALWRHPRLQHGRGGDLQDRQPRARAPPTCAGSRRSPAPPRSTGSAAAPTSCARRASCWGRRRTRWRGRGGRPSRSRRRARRPATPWPGAWARRRRGCSARLRSVGGISVDRRGDRVRRPEAAARARQPGAVLARGLGRRPRRRRRRQGGAGRAVLAGAVERGLSAGAVIREAAAVVGGGGGGRDDMAQAGGRDAEKLAEAIATARATIERGLG